MSAGFGDFNVLFPSCSHGNIYHIKPSHSEIGKQLYVPQCLNLDWTHLNYYLKLWFLTDKVGKNKCT